MNEIEAQTLLADIIHCHPVLSNYTPLYLQNVDDFVTAKGFPKGISMLPIRPPWRCLLAFFRENISKTPVAIVCNSDDENQLAIHMLFNAAGMFRLMGSTVIKLTSSGCWDISVPGSWHVPPRPLYISEEDRGQILNEMLTILWVGLTFCHCRNIVIEKVPVCRTVRRRAERNREPVVEHHHLVIEPIRKILNKEGGLTEHGDLVRAMHICRGHFAHYGEQFGTGKLFGKYEGQFWMPQHLRGNLDKGIVTKDYAIADQVEA